jgi:hypothetical protein
VTERIAILDKAGEIFGAYLMAYHPTVKGPGLRLYGTAYVDATKTYEAAYFDFDLDGFKFLGFNPEVNVVREVAEQPGDSAFLDAASDGEFFGDEPIGVYAGGFLTGSSLAPVADPAKDWFAVSPSAGFVTMGFVPDDGITRLNADDGVYDVASLIPGVGGGSWNVGTSSDRAVMWPNPIAEPQGISGSHRAALAAVGGTYYTLIGGAGDAGAAWIWDFSDPKNPTITALSAYKPAAGSAVLGVDEAGISRLTLAGVEEKGQPILWTAQGTIGTVLGKGDGGIAFDVLDHPTGHVVGGVYAGFPFFWNSGTAADQLTVLDKYGFGEVNRLIPLTPIDFYRWEK